jgi:glycosyltransferase involved in cell wall biosynthesis
VRGVKPRVAIVGPVYPYRAGIAYCTTRLAQELRADVISFARLYPKRFYPGGQDIDPTLPRAEADFLLDILNPLTWIRARRRLMDYDVVIFVWWIWVWAIPYWVMMGGAHRVILQCHNIGEKEPAQWKRWLANLVFRRADLLVVHAKSEAEEARRRTGAEVVATFLPVHELGREIPSRADGRARLRIARDANVALFFGHIRPFKGLGIALQAWQELKTPATLLVAGEPWWNSRVETDLPNVRLDLRFIPDAEIATYFAAADVVLAPYRSEAQSGVALTAFHFARPVIATAVGGLPEIIDDRNGILVPPENAAALARAVEEFFTQRDRQAMEHAAAESARRYSWAEYGAIMSRLVERRAFSPSAA